MTYDSADRGIGTDYPDNECGDPNCIVCCDDETFARLTKFRTDNMMTLIDMEDDND